MLETAARQRATTKRAHDQAGQRSAAPGCAIRMYRQGIGRRVPALLQSRFETAPHPDRLRRARRYARRKRLGAAHRCERRERDGAA